MKFMLRNRSRIRIRVIKTWINIAKTCFSWWSKIILMKPVNRWSRIRNFKRTFFHKIKSLKLKSRSRYWNVTDLSHICPEVKLSNWLIIMIMKWLIRLKVQGVIMYHSKIFCRVAEMVLQVPVQQAFKCTWLK